MGVARYVNMAFVATGLLAWVVLADFFKWAIEMAGPSYNSQIIGHNFRLAELLGLVLALAAMVVGGEAWAQQEAQSSTYFVAPLPVNPALAGSVGQANVRSISRIQWAGFDDANTSELKEIAVYKLVTIKIAVSAILVPLGLVCLTRYSLSEDQHRSNLKNLGYND